MKWINVKDELPPSRKDVLVYFENSYKKKIITIATYIPPKTVDASDFLSEDCEGMDEYDEEKDIYWVKENWYEWQYEADINYCISEEVLFWSYLPDFPIALIN